MFELLYCAELFADRRLEGLVGKLFFVAISLRARSKHHRHTDTLAVAIDWPTLAGNISDIQLIVLTRTSLQRLSNFTVSYGRNFLCFLVAKHQRLVLAQFQTHKSLFETKTSERL